jgi:protein phosphatase 1 regulatory subunit 7
LNLNNNKIRKIENLGELVHLKRLELRSNRVTKWENLDNLKGLTFITLSTNLITEIRNIGIYIELEELGLFGNYIGMDLM